MARPKLPVEQVKSQVIFSLLTRAQREALDEVANATDRSRCSVVRKAVLEFVERQQEEENQGGDVAEG